MEQNLRNFSIYFYNGDVITATGSISQQESYCSSFNFLRSHKSYLVNLAYVTVVHKDLLVFEMCNGSNVYIRRGSFVSAKHAFESYLFEHARSFL